MLIEFQPDLFDREPTERLERKLAEMQESLNRVRKSLYARNNELEKMFFELHTRVDILEKNICKG